MARRIHSDHTQSSPWSSHKSSEPVGLCLRSAQASAVIATKPHTSRKSKPPPRSRRSGKELGARRKVSVLAQRKLGAHRSRSTLAAISSHSRSTTRTQTAQHDTSTQIPPRIARMLPAARCPSQLIDGCTPSGQCDVLLALQEHQLPPTHSSSRSQ